MSLPNKSPRVNDAARPHQCPECDRTYERPDHLARHLDSRAHDASYQNTRIVLIFHPRDVLQRHQLLHSAGKPVGKYRGRAVEACEECSTAKSSCSNSRPCNRCQRKGLPCVPRKCKQRRDHALATPATDLDLHGDFGESLNDAASPTLSLEGDYTTCQTRARLERTDSSLYSPVTPTSSVLPYTGYGSRNNVADSYQEVNEFPAFFEHVMLPTGTSPSNGNPGVQQPRGVFDFMEPDFNSPGAGLFGSDILLDLDKILEFDPSGDVLTPGLDGSSEEQSARQRVAAFRKSLWLWVPEKNQTGFSDDEQIPLRDADMTASISSLHRSRLESLNIRGKLSQQLRDNIFQLVIGVGKSKLSVSTFPSAESLDALIKIGISKRTETDAWIHPYTLYRQDSRPELLTALVAAGCVCSAIPSVGKAGVALLEVVRVSLAQLVESDNSFLRDLQYFQASMMWLDIGIFCGYKRKMQIAEGNLQPLCTALRRAGAFDRSFYSQRQSPHVSLNGQSLEEAWSEWVQQESLKRLAYHLFEHDVEAATAMNRPALTSYTEFTLPFPSARDLWLAPTATAWKALWETKYSHSEPTKLSLRDLLADPSLLNQPLINIDTGVVNSALLHGLMSQVWEFRQQALLADSSQSTAKAVTRLWLQSRQEDLLSLFNTVKDDIGTLPANATLFTQFALMHLHVHFDSIQRFAGQFGELEARQEYPRLRAWGLTKESRLSIWHAGQVLRAARQVPPFQLRGFDSLAIYHAVLVLWVAGLLRCGERQTDIFASSPGYAEVLVGLDGAETEATKAFVNRDIGQPALTLQTTSPGGEQTTILSSLRSPRLVMDAGRQVFDGNLQGAEDNLPPLIDNLRKLMHDLGNLP
ncbi:hypothetical protein BJY04DRAFT_226549 [Aspergillus karnatakaensis]|uniref:uncharacterized protein n=1 Tax=Aspergillus karnatakaensis TaxID=1810916 RepID=UPI003CCD525C